MKQVEFVPFRFTDVVDIYSIRIDGKENTEFQEFMINFKDTDNEYLTDEEDEFLSDSVNLLQSIDIELRKLEEDGVNLHQEINNLKISI